MAVCFYCRNGQHTYEDACALKCLCTIAHVRAIIV